MKDLIKIAPSVQAGARLRRLRESLGYSLRDVQKASIRIAAIHGSLKFAIPFSRLRHIETSHVVPSIHRLYTLGLLYRIDYSSIIEWYGIEWNSMRMQLQAGIPPLTHRIDLSSATEAPSIAAVTPKRTTLLDAKQICTGCDVIRNDFTGVEEKTVFYACIGMEDYTMYPLLMPGTLLKVDGKYSRVTTSHWKSEYERPIYFIETRNGYRVGWCSHKAAQLTVYSHPLSPALPITYAFPREAEVLGQVTEITMPLRSRGPKQFKESVG